MQLVAIGDHCRDRSAMLFGDSITRSDRLLSAAPYNGRVERSLSSTRPSIFRGIAFDMNAIESATDRSPHPSAAVLATKAANSAD